MGRTSQTEAQSNASGEDTEDTGPVLSRVQRAAIYLREDLGESAQIADLGGSTSGLNLNLTDVARDELLAELRPAIRALGFVDEPDTASA